MRNSKSAWGLSGRQWLATPATHRRLIGICYVIGIQFIVLQYGLVFRLQIYLFTLIPDAIIASFYAIINAKMPPEYVPKAFDSFILFWWRIGVLLDKILGQNTELFLETLGKIRGSIETRHVANLINLALALFQ